MSYPGVEHNLENHSVKANQATWVAIASVEPLAYAYMKKEGEEYDCLKYVFGHSPPIPVPEGTMVNAIEISSDNESMNIDNDVDVDMDQCNNDFDRSSFGTLAEALKVTTWDKHLLT